jgi:hypothetical protein
MIFVVTNLLGVEEAGDHLFEQFYDLVVHQASYHRILEPLEPRFFQL